MSRRTSICITTIALALAIATGSAAAATKPTAAGTGGAAATVDRLATRAAIQTMRRGGNAVDAAVSAASVLGVTEPFSSGIGGGGFMLIRLPNGKVRTIDGRETAPAAMVPDSFFENGEPLEFDEARYSGLSVGTPGTVATWDQAISRYGRLTLPGALTYGIDVAERGFRIDQTFFDQTEENLDYFDDVPSTEALYLDPDGTPRDVGTRLRNPGLARAYRRIARLGPDGFYEGKLAVAMASAAQTPPVVGDHVWRPGLLTTNDLAAYDAVKRPPTRVDYRGLEVWGMGPPSSGGSTVGEALNILEGYEPLSDDTTEALHRYLEASRYAYADRGAYLADPDFFGVPLDGLLSDSYAAERRALITDQAADAEPVEPGVPPGAPTAARVGVDTEGTSTTHLTVADDRGMVVSYTFTIESTGGSGIAVPGWGFLLNNELTDFTFDDTRAANAPLGGKRPRSSMAPTLVTRNGRPVLALGSPGGSTIITTVLQILVNRFDFGMGLPEAVAAPRASQRNDTETEAEPAFIASAEGQALASTRGHALVVPESSPEIGAATAIEFLRGGVLQAVAEPVRRGGGSAMVVGDG